MASYGAPRLPVLHQVYARTWGMSGRPFADLDGDDSDFAAASSTSDIRGKCEDWIGHQDRIGDVPDLRCGHPNGSYRKPEVTWENPP